METTITPDEDATPAGPASSGGPAACSVDLAPPVAAERPIVEIKGFTKAYGRFTAVKDLSLSVQPGEILALVGPNGAGKTTTLRMLMGILSPTSGTAKIAGHDCFRARHRVMGVTGYLPDDPLFYEHLTGREIVRFCGTMHGIEPHDVNKTVAALSGRLDLKDALGEYAVNYSMGMKKKLALVCALLHDPKVLILDEPTNGLDPVVTRALLTIVRERSAAGTAVIYSTHLLEQADRLCHRVGIVYGGVLAALGTPTELRNTFAPGGSLEDVFFKVTGADAPLPSGPAE